MCLLILLFIVVDQIIKIWVKTHMQLGESIHITDWFYIVFIENNGMAYGMSFIDKPILTLFRIFASGVIGYYIYKVISRPHNLGYVVCLSMILAGAAGNIFDCLFYGQIFNFADSSISVGMVVLVLFYRKELENFSKVFFERTRFAKKDVSLTDKNENTDD